MFFAVTLLWSITNGFFRVPLIFNQLTGFFNIFLAQIKTKKFIYNSKRYGKHFHTNGLVYFLFDINKLFNFRNGPEMGNRSPSSGRGASRLRGPTGSRRERTSKRTVTPSDSRKWRNTTTATRWRAMTFFKTGHPPSLFHLFLSFQTNNTQFLQQGYVKMSIQYMVQGFEPMTFWTWVSSHNH